VCAGGRRRTAGTEATEEENGGDTRSEETSTGFG